MKQNVAVKDSIVSNVSVPENKESVKQDQKTGQLTALKVHRGSIAANLISIFLLRIASRTSFLLLSFYLGEHFASATLVALVLETFYLSELALAPVAGSLSDRLGRKPFLLAAPALGAAASLCLLISAWLFPRPNAHGFDIQIVVLLLLILLGRLFEGATTALNTPATLGYITDATMGMEKTRTRIMTAFEVATVGGLALGIPFGGQVSKFLGIWGFLLVIALHLVNITVIALMVKESKQHVSVASRHGSLWESLKMLRHKRIFTFLPAWFSVNTLVGSWMTLIVIILTYPNPQADQRHPGQLLYGGFSKETATLLLGGFAIFFLIGMGAWTLLLPRFRRTSVMSIGLAGLAICVVVLTFINGLAENINSLSGHGYFVILTLIPVLLLGVFLLSGFTPAALTHMAAISETMPGKRGAVMGLYSVVLAIGQLVGASLGGLSVDINGFYGLMAFSAALGLCSLVSVLYIRLNGHDRPQQTPALAGENEVPKGNDQTEQKTAHP